MLSQQERMARPLAALPPRHIAALETMKREVLSPEGYARFVAEISESPVALNQWEGIGERLIEGIAQARARRAEVEAHTLETHTIAGR